MRLFIASPVKLYDYTAIREEFAPVLTGKWVEEENLHLTWVFLGEQSSADPYLEKLRTIHPLENRSKLHSVSFFGHPPRIFFARSSSETLFRKIEEFRELGFAMKRFRLHATLCRIKKIEDWKGFKKLQKKYRGKSVGEVLPEIALYESTLTDKGPVYKKIGAVTK